ncbi:hypothetical protein E2C01_063448 [Portunus trituberculatus]|uniref:Uncharacterized protein n=1 Tax=Portunus trituberculatus TaxID=210409 RepID=A0A5B7H963_PORTR|nr:hypothetical protein [Portunus trituberculatus]
MLRVLRCLSILREVMVSVPCLINVTGRLGKSYTTSLPRMSSKINLLANRELQDVASDSLFSPASHSWALRKNPHFCDQENTEETLTSKRPL